MPYLVIDFETLWTESVGLVPIEVGCCLIRDDLSIQTEPFFQECMYPYAGFITPRDTALTGITHEIVVKARSYEEVFFELNQRCAELEEFTAIAHNVPFDRSIVMQHQEHLPLFANASWIDTIQVAKRELVLDSYSLDSVAEHLDLSIQGHRHRSFPDALITAEAFCVLEKRRLARGVQSSLF